MYDVDIHNVTETGTLGESLAYDRLKELFYLITGRVTPEHLQIVGFFINHEQREEEVCIYYRVDLDQDVAYMGFPVLDDFRRDDEALQQFDLELEHILVYGHIPQFFDDLFHLVEHAGELRKAELQVLGCKLLQVANLVDSLNPPLKVCQGFADSAAEAPCQEKGCRQWYQGNQCQKY